MSVETVAMQEQVNELKARFWTLHRLEGECFERMNEIFNERCRVSDRLEFMEQNLHRLKKALNV